MDIVVTLLFLALWIVVAFFALRFVGMRYFHEPRRADVAALAVAVAFAAGTLWPFSARSGSQPAPNVQPLAVATSAAAQPAPAAEVLGSITPPGTHDVSASCRSAKGSFRSTTDGSIDEVRKDAREGEIVADGGRLDHMAQYIVQGWAAEPAAVRPALAACLLVDGKVDSHSKPYFGTARPDLGTGFHHDELVPSGYVIVIPAGSLAQGKHRLEVLARLAGGKFVTLPAAREVTVY